MHFRRLFSTLTPRSKKAVKSYTLTHYFSIAITIGAATTTTTTTAAAAASGLSYKFTPHMTARRKNWYVYFMNVFNHKISVLLSPKIGSTPFYTYTHTHTNTYIYLFIKGKDNLPCLRHEGIYGEQMYSSTLS